MELDLHAGIRWNYIHPCTIRTEGNRAAFRTSIALQPAT